MPETKHITTKATVTPDGDEQGVLEAVFSVFDVVDRDGDVVTRSAFKSGQAVPMVWAHDWSKPIGDGKISVQSDRAVFKGRLWLDTEDGLQAFRKIRNAGALQEFSWGFQITDAEPGKVDGKDVRLITGTEVFEVSPVLVGANRQTQTLAIKAAVVDEPPVPAPEPERAPAAADLDAIESYVASVKAAPPTTYDDRAAVELVVERLAIARGELERLLRDSDPAATTDLRNLKAQFEAMQVRWGLAERE